MRIALVALAFPLLALAEPATVVRATDLKQSPATDASTLAPLAESAKVQTLERKGGWTRVTTEAGAEGWVRMLALRYSGAGEVKSGDSSIVQLLNVARTGYDAYGLPAVLQTLQAMNPADSGLALMFKTHPVPAERLDALEKMQPTLDAYAAQQQLAARFLGALGR